MKVTELHAFVPHSPSWIRVQAAQGQSHPAWIFDSSSVAAAGGVESFGVLDLA